MTVDLAERFSRHHLLEQIGREGQQRLAAGAALVVGCGALGSRQAELLVRAGVGTVRLTDRDVVELSNLHRQALFDEDDAAAARPKAEAAARRLQAINSAVTIDARVIEVTPHNIEPLLRGVDVVLDGTDNFETRYLVNDACVKHRLPWIYGGVVETHGMTMTIRPGQTPCLRCLFPEPPETGTIDGPDAVGILGTLPALIATLQVTEALKLLVGAADPSPHLLQLDPWENVVRQLAVTRHAGCPCCGAGQFPFLDAPRATTVTRLGGRDQFQINPSDAHPRDLVALGKELTGQGHLADHDHYLELQVARHTLLFFADGRITVKGVSDPDDARAVASRFVELP